MECSDTPADVKGHHRVVSFGLSTLSYNQSQGYFLLNKKRNKIKVIDSEKLLVSCYINHICFQTIVLSF